jgi:protein-S-isoprenylcysteine O-methyltransferase Ste14
MVMNSGDEKQERRPRSSTFNARKIRRCYHRAGMFHQRAASFFGTHRILVSRLFGVAFFLIVLASESVHEGTVFEAVLFLAGLVLVGIATVGRLWCSLYVSGYKDTELITTGPYSVSRNPLYFFSLLGFAGIGFATETVTLGIALPLITAIGYPAVIKREEHQLRERFGTAFEAYCARTPRFFPDFSRFTEPASYVVNPRLFRRTMIDVIWFVWFVGLIELVEALHELHVFAPLIRLY